MTLDLLAPEPSPLPIGRKVLNARKKSIRYYHLHRRVVNEKRYAKRRAETVYHCSCGAVFVGSGSWQLARIHSLEGHKVKQDGRQVRWKRDGCRIVQNHPSGFKPECKS